MNYKHIYKQIIENRQQNLIESGYTENHHIKPKSLGGTNDKNNLVKLTAREHFICHYLLAKMYKKESFEWYKMNNAFMIMKCSSLNQFRYFNSRLYESLKINFSSVISKNQFGKNNSNYGTIWICNLELKENKKINKIDDIPDGWIKGRNKWNEIERKQLQIEQKNEKKKKLKIERQQRQIEQKKEKRKKLKIKKEMKEKQKLRKEEKQKLRKEEKQKLFKESIFLSFEKFKNGNYTSMSDFARKENINKMTLSKRWIKYIEEYKTIHGTKFVI